MSAKLGPDWSGFARVIALQKMAFSDSQSHYRLKLVYTGFEPIQQEDVRPT